MSYPAKGTQDWKDPLEIAITAQIAAALALGGTFPITFDDGTDTYIIDVGDSQLNTVVIEDADSGHSAAIDMGLGTLGPVESASVGLNASSTGSTQIAALSVESTPDLARLFISLDGNAAAIYTGTSDPNGVVGPAEKGSLFIDISAPALYQNTDDATAWSLVGSGGLEDFNVNGPATMTAVAGQMIMADTTAADVTVNLPAGFGAQIIGVKKDDDSAHIVTIVPNGAETIDGQANRVLTAAREAVQLFNDSNGNWAIIAAVGSVDATIPLVLDNAGYRYALEQDGDGQLKVGLSQDSSPTDNYSEVEFISSSPGVGGMFWQVGTPANELSLEMSVTDPSTMDLFLRVNGVRRWSLNETGAMDLPEQSVPPAPAANTARVFARDSGSGKTQLCVIFPTGAVQTIATEP